MLFVILCSFFMASCLGNIEEKKEEGKSIDIQELSYWECSDSLRFEQLPKEKRRVIEWAKFFLETPYKGATLEVGDDFKTIINFDVFDCTTFVENILTLASLDKVSEDDFSRVLMLFRYRTGKPLGYPSRLHYFSEWIKVNQEKGLIEDLTKELGGIEVKEQINFMTKHRKSYPALKNEANYQKIKKIEERLSQYPMYIIPKQKLSEVSEYIKDGDVIALATSISGLDFVHLGFAIWQNKTLHLLHASSTANKVIISEETLENLLNRRSNVCGIAVLRLKKESVR